MITDFAIPSEPILLATDGLKRDISGLGAIRTHTSAEPDGSRARARSTSLGPGAGCLL